MEPEAFHYTDTRCGCLAAAHNDGAIARLGERFNGIEGSSVRFRLAPPNF